MARASKNAKIDTRNSRKSLAIQAEPHWFKLDDGAHLGYRKTGDDKGTWVARYYTKHKGRRFASLGAADDTIERLASNELSYKQAKALAEAEVVQWQEEDKTGVSRNLSYTVADAVNDYLDDKEREKRKPQERARAMAKSHILPQLGTIQLSSLTRDQVKTWRDKIAASAPRQRTGFEMKRVQVKKMVRGELKDVWVKRATDKQLPQAFRAFDASDRDAQRQRQASTNRILTVLKAALNHAHEHRKVSSSAAWEAIKPFRKVDLPKVRFLTTEEVAALIPACESKFQELVKAALLTGCRFGELTAMRVEHFNAVEGTVYVADSKNGESRYVDLNNEGTAHFEAITDGRKPKDTIFVRANGAAWKPSEQKRPIDAACELAKIEGVTFHILRHTYASHAVMNGMPIAVLSEHLGHKDTRITERHYAHLSQTYKRKLIQANAPSFGFESNKPGPMLVARAS